ncbi:MAG: FecR family protein [Hoylesella buccalis]|uniref:Anti-sigma factor n=1 Tax=Hoylesella buccalis TaxID=28127 RepID=A0A2N6QTG3_9BACT|nr:FecR family protein [Hoylesella buccalis]PMC25330.1 anti-sigma factor [Hoylesella buccalis]
MKIDKHLQTLWEEDVNKMSEGELHQALDIFRQNRTIYSRSVRRRSRVSTILRYAAIFMLPLLSAILVWLFSASYYANDMQLAEYYVPKGYIDSLVLSDDTKVVINSGTTIVYPHSFSSHAKERSVFVNGSCHFEVSKDASHPFVVHLGNVKVRVLGTHFSVNSYSDEEQVVVTLEEGSVNVSDSIQTMTLNPNEQLVYSRTAGTMHKQIVDAMAYNSWVKGGLNFTQEPLEKILKSIERRYRVSISIAKDVDSKRCYTMNFKKGETIERIMNVLTFVSGDMTYTKDGDRIFISNR